MIGLISNDVTNFKQVVQSIVMLIKLVHFAIRLMKALGDTEIA